LFIFVGTSIVAQQSWADVSKRYFRTLK